MWNLTNKISKQNKTLSDLFYGCAGSAALVLSCGGSLRIVCHLSISQSQVWFREPPIYFPRINALKCSGLCIFSHRCNVELAASICVFSERAHTCQLWRLHLCNCGRPWRACYRGTGRVMGVFISWLWGFSGESYEIFAQASWWSL